MLSRDCSLLRDKAISGRCCQKNSLGIASFASVLQPALIRFALYTRVSGLMLVKISATLCPCIPFCFLKCGFPELSNYDASTDLRRFNVRACGEKMQPRLTSLCQLVTASNSRRWYLIDRRESKHTTENLFDRRFVGSIISIISCVPTIKSVVRLLWTVYANRL